MTLEYIKGNAHCQYWNGQRLNGILEDGLLLMGYLNINFDIDGKKVINKKRIMKIVKQNKWYLHIPIMIHEFGHYLIDLIFPVKADSKMNPMHNLVEVLLNLNVLFLIEGGKYE